MEQEQRVLLVNLQAEKAKRFLAQADDFVKTGVVDVVYGSFLARMFQLRQKADYNCAYDISEEEVREIIGLSHDFVNVVLSLAE